MMRAFFEMFEGDLLRVLGVMIAVGAPVAILLTHVHHQYEITRLGYQIAQVTREHRSLLETNKKLRVEAAIQGRSERITTVARERFGLEMIRADQIVLLEPQLPGIQHAALER
jgi:cell division protein FtsL